jgi:hypothetical protein
LLSTVDNVSMTFTKLFNSITESTIWTEPDHTRLVWITMLAMSDHVGRVWGSIPGLANRARVPLEKCEEALASLMGPDKYSRTREHDGRRVVEIDGGWRLLNHAKYRAIRDEESIKESKRRYINTRRAAERETSSTSSTVDRCRPIAEAYTEAEAEIEASSMPRGAPLKPPLPSVASAEQAPAARKKRVAKPKETAQTAETWRAYSEAYADRYGVDPVRNAKVNSQMAQVLQRLGADEAPGVARFYLSHRNSLYVNAKHCTDLLLRDAEKLRTEWATGEVTYRRDAHESDRLASVGGMVERIEQRLAEKGIR